MSTVAPAYTVLAGSNMDYRPGSDGSGLIAFLVVAALVVICLLLWRSMRGHLRKINFEQPTEPATKAPTGGSAGSEPT